MPIPKPKAKESQKDFMMRCIPQLTKYHNKEQATAICYKTYREKNSKQLNPQKYFNNTIGL